METITQGKVRIESEFDEPLRDVITGFAEMSYSKARIAEALEVTEPSLRHFCHKQGIHFPRSPRHHRDITGRPPRRIRHNGQEKSLSEWAWDLGVAPSTIHKRLRTTGSVSRY
jgi:hypothetical protein